MIVYGKGQYYKRKMIRGVSYCQNCDSITKCRSYSTRDYIHIYFIPLIPIGRSVRKITECKNCKSAGSIFDADVEDFLIPLHNRMQNFMNKLLKGKEGIFEKEEVYWPLMIAHEFPRLLGLGDKQTVLDVIQKLKENREYQAIDKGLHVIPEAIYFLHEGKSEQAMQMMMQAAKKNKDPWLYYIVAFYLSRVSNHGEAFKMLQKALELRPNYLPWMLELLNICINAGDYAKAVKIFELCQKLNYAKMSTDEMIDLYKKICKRAKVEGKSHITSQKWEYQY